MKSWKIFTLCAAALLVLAPATAMAKSHFSLSINLFDAFPRLVVVPPPPPPPPVYERVIVPCPVVPYVEQRTVVREYYYYPCESSECYYETIQPKHSQQKHYPRHQSR